MSWSWSPIPHLDPSGGWSIGLVAVNGLVYFAAFLALLAVLTVLLRVTGAFMQGFREERQR